MTQSVDLNEAVTRARLIDPALQQAGWDTGNPEQVGMEIPVDGSSPAKWQRLRQKLQAVHEVGATYDVRPADLPSGISDYALYRPNGEIIGIVEAKRTSIDPRLAEAQAEFYVTEIAEQQSFSPFGFTSNGRSIQFLDGEWGMRPVQVVRGDHTDRIRFLRLQEVLDRSVSRCNPRLSAHSCVPSLLVGVTDRESLHKGRIATRRDEMPAQT